MPFWEAPDRFDNELANLAEVAAGPSRAATQTLNALRPVDRGAGGHDA
jgi:hypothetical protein